MLAFLSGDVSLVRAAMERCRDSMQQLLELTQLPEMMTSEETQLSLDRVRNTPLAQEQEIIWAIQQEDDVTTRQRLPPWIAQPVERALVKWTEIFNKWQTKIDDRASEGKELTPCMKKNYDDWLQSSSEISFLFSRQNKRVVHRIRRNADAKRMKADLFSVQVTCSAERRLLVLKGKPTSENAEDIPGFLDHIASNGVISAVQAQQEKQMAEAEDGSDVDGEARMVEEDEKMMEAEAIGDAGSDAELEEVLAATSEEEDLVEMMEGSYKRVKTFTHREAYRLLETQGLTDLPPGMHISFHKGTRTWTGHVPGMGSAGMCYTFGGTTNRSEPEALLKVLKSLLQNYLDRFPRDKAWQRQLAKISNAECTTPVFR